MMMRVIETERSLDKNGLCCGRKPVADRAKNVRTCKLCDRAYALQADKQIPNFAWIPYSPGIWERAKV